MGIRKDIQGGVKARRLDVWFSATNIHGAVCTYMYIGITLCVACLPYVVGTMLLMRGWAPHA